MEETGTYVTVKLRAEQIIYSFQEGLKSYGKLRLKGRGIKGNYYFVNVPRLFIGEKYSPERKYSISFGQNKENNHSLVVIDLDDQKDFRKKL